MSEITPPRTDVFSKLAGLRAGLRQVTVLTGLAWAACALAAFVLLTFVVDYGFWLLLWKQGGLKPTTRMIVSGLCSVGVLYTLWRYLLAPQMVEVSDEDLALRVESHYPQLADRLISTVQFRLGSAGAPGRSDSRQLIDHVIAETERFIGRFDFTAMLDWKSLTVRVIVGVTALGMIVGAFLVPPRRPGQARIMNVWLQRNVLFRNVPYPGYQEDTAQFRLVVAVGEGGSGRYRQIDPSTLGVLSDSPLDVVVRAEPIIPGDTEAVLPEQVSLRVANESYETPLEADATGRFTYEFARVTSAFEFTVSAETVQSGKVIGGPYRVVLERPPELKNWRIKSVPPGYTGMRPLEYTSANRLIEVESEGTLVLVGESDYRLRQASLTLQRPATSEGTDPPAPLIAGQDFTRLAGNKGPKDSPGLTTTFELEIGVSEPGKAILSCALTDERGYVNPEAIRDLEITVRKKDEPPRITLTHPGTRDRITPAAALRFELRAEDDRGFLGRNPLDRENLSVSPFHREEWATKAWPGTYLMFRIRAFAGDGENVTTLEGRGGEPMRFRLPAGVLPDLDTSPLRELMPTSETNRDGKLRWVWEPNLGIVDKARQLFSPGDKIDIWMVCKDNCRRPKPVTLVTVGGFTAGTDVLRYRDDDECKSEVIRLTVVEPDDLLRQLTQQRRQILEALKAIKHNQEDLRDFMSRVTLDLSRPEAKPDDTLKLMNLVINRAGEQGDLVRRLTRSADLLGAVYAEMEVNRLASQKDRTRLQDDVLIPLKGLGYGVIRTGEALAADPFLKDTPAASAAELARLLPLLERWQARLGRGPLVDDIASEMKDLADVRGRTPSQLALESRKITERQTLAITVLDEIIKAMQLDISSSLEEIIRLIRERVIRHQEQVKRDTERLARELAESLFNDM